MDKDTDEILNAIKKYLNVDIEESADYFWFTKPEVMDFKATLRYNHWLYTYQEHFNKLIIVDGRKVFLFKPGVKTIKKHPSRKTK